ncbi:MAG: helix-turn-helix domain-containing protein [Alphaproteobacteria bacterium]|nr:helix-turn-helix domain-containing protein [Alphaproteobacteria bacterium]
MLPGQIRELRISLGFTQGQFAQLLGVHSLTVSKWERGLLSPSPRQVALMNSFQTATVNQPDIGTVVAGLLVGAGISAALFFILKAAFEDD